MIAEARRALSEVKHAGSEIVGIETL
jgi:hypothetical protein